MNIEKIEKNGTISAAVRSDEIMITDTRSALDLLMTAKYDLGTKNIVIDKKRIKEEFFILSSGLAGDILQKYINYGGRIAIYDDYSHYTSNPLHDFIYESNQGHDVFFATTENEAVDEWLQLWYENYAKPSARAFTAAYYKNYIDQHIVPRIGTI